MDSLLFSFIFCLTENSGLLLVFLSYVGRGCWCIILFVFATEHGYGSGGVLQQLWLHTGMASADRHVSVIFFPYGADSGQIRSLWAEVSEITSMWSDHKLKDEELAQV